MDWKLKNMWPAVTASLVAFTAVVNADYSQQNQMNQQQMNGNGQQMQGSSQQQMVRSGKGPDMMINPNANLTNQFFITGEALFGWMREGGLEFGVYDPCFDECCCSLEDSSILNPKTKWNTGFRIGAGYVFKPDGWDLYASWTNFNSKSSKNNTCCYNPCCPTEICGTCPVITLYSNMPIDCCGCNIYADCAEASWKLKLNVVDLELGRAFMTSKWLELRPFISVRGAWADESYKIQYEGLHNVREETPFIECCPCPDYTDLSKVKMTNNWWGVGPRVGLNSRWGFGWGMSLYGNASISLLYGNFNVKQGEVACRVFEVCEELDCGDCGDCGSGNDCGECCETCEDCCCLMTFRDVYHLGRATTDLALGLMWEHTFDSDWELGFNIGWEQHLFFNSNQFWRVARTNARNNSFSHERGDLSFQAIALGGYVSF